MINLLIIDDEQILIDMMKVVVDYAEFNIDNVYFANNMKEAQNIMKQNQIDIALCDIEMPGGSGLDLILWINEYYPNTIKIILSAHNEFEFAQRAVTLHCYSYMLKPATADMMTGLLPKVVKEVLNRRSDIKLRTLGEDYAKTISSEEESDVIEAVRKYIDQHINEELVVEKLSQMAYVSQNHLTRSFKKKFGMTVIDYITEHRLTLAESMLKNTNKTVTMIADEVGYFDYVYFSKLFKRHYGMTPREYRIVTKSKDDLV